MTSIKDYKVDSDVAVDGASIKAITDGEQEEDVSIIGHIISYTIGSDFVVPRDWLKDRMEGLGLVIEAPGGETELMIPPKVTPKRAFNRTRDRIVDEISATHPDFHGEGKREIEDRMTQFASKKATNDQWHITAESYFTADELNRAADGEPYDDGEFRQTTLLVARYDKEHEALTVTPKVSEQDSLWPSYEVFEEKAYSMFEEMQYSHIGRDIQKMFNRFVNHWTDTIKVRDGGAVYFVPAGYDAEVRALKTLIEEINDTYKTRGRDCEVLRISVTDSDEERRQVKRKVRDHLEDQVETALDATFDALAEDDNLPEDVAGDLQDRLKDLDSFADDYNALLSAKLSAQKVLRDKLRELDGQREEIVEQVLEDPAAP